MARRFSQHDMKNKIGHIIFLLLVFVTTTTYGQQAEYNSGNNWVHPGTLKQTGMNFINSPAGILMNNGTVWYTGDFHNDGEVNYDTSFAPYPGLSRFQGTSSQTLSGNGHSSFYNLLFSGASFSLQQNITVSHQIDFDKGIIAAQQTTPATMMNTLQMLAGSSWINASDACHVDGFVQKTGNTAFVFPIGSGGYYRPVALGATAAVTNVFAARYIYADPSLDGYLRTRKTGDVGEISDKEYWIVLRSAGSSTPQLTLTWDTHKTSAPVPTDLSKLQVVRWDGTQWICEGNIATTGDASQGSVTANVTGYGVFALATVFSNVFALNDTFDVVQNSVLKASVSANDTVSVGTNTWSVLSLPLHGSLTMRANGSFTYTPDADYSGTDSFTYTLSDALGGSSTATASVAVLPVTNYLKVDKSSSEPVLQSDGTFTWKYFITMTNVQTTAIDSVRVTDDLSKVFSAPVDFEVTSISATGGLISNGLYDGVSRTDLLLDVSSLPANSKDSVTIELKVNPHDYVGAVYNQAQFEGTLNVFGTVSNLLSDDPTNTGSTDYRRPTVTNIPAVAVIIPNGFSPNNDGFNDTFVITASSDLQVSLEVFNRWGAGVYKNTNYQNDWDGKGTGALLGSDLLEGTYYYIIETTHSITREVKKYSGFITLKR